MRKILTFITISITLVALMLCGWTAYAATSPNTTTSTSVKGTFKSVSSDTVTVTTDKGDQTVPLAKSVWVYRDDQKALLTDLHAGDRIELIVNSKQQAAYVKATSAETAVPEKAQPAAPEPTPASSTVTKGQAAAPVVKEPVSTINHTSGQDKEVYPDLEDIDLKVDGKHFKLHIGQTKGVNGIIYDLNIKPEDAGMIHLKGEQAALWIQKLLASIDLKSSDAEQEVAQLIAEHYGLEAGKLNVQLKTNWEQNQKGEHEDEDEDDSKNRNKDNHSKNSGKSDDHKKNEKQRGNSNNNKNNQHDN
jgi:hypothetical protein